MRALWYIMKYRCYGYVIYIQFYVIVQVLFIKPDLRLLLHVILWSCLSSDQLELRRSKSIQISCLNHQCLTHQLNSWLKRLDLKLELCKNTEYFLSIIYVYCSGGETFLCSILFPVIWIARNEDCKWFKL